MYCFSQVQTASRVYARTHSFPHSDTYTDPQPSWLSCTESPPPPPVSLHFYTQVNLQMQHTCILTSYTRMHACTLPEPPFSFLPLPLSNTPSARVKLCCRSGSRGVQRVSLAFLASVSPPPPALHTVALNSFVFFFCLVNKCVRALLGAVVCG